MIKNPEFRVHYVLPDRLKEQKGSVISDFFDCAVQSLKWFDERSGSGNENLRKATQEAYAYSNRALEYARKTAVIEETTTGLLFSFAIENNREDFKEVNEEGRRMWLRQHLDDDILHYAIPALLSQSYDDLWEGKVPTDRSIRLKSLFDGMKEALKHAYKKKSSTFWIDGE